MNTPLEAAFQEFGDGIQQRWRSNHFADEALPPIAMEALLRFRFHEWVRLDALAPLILRGNAQPIVPVNTQFADAAVKLYIAPRFFVEALVWTDGTTAIHQHGFSGAFTVLQGSSFHGMYGFEMTERVSPAMFLGRLQLQGTELLAEGDVRPITSGASFIHSLFHLDSPSVSLVVRSFSNRDVAAQMMYLPPGLADDPFFRDASVACQLRFLNALVRLDDPGALSMLRAYLQQSDLHSAYRALLNLRTLLSKKNLLTVAFGFLHDAHGNRAVWLERAIQEVTRREALESRRKLIKEPDLRFFLALLLNAPDRASIRALTYARFPDREVDARIATWIADLCNVDGFTKDESAEAARCALRDPSEDSVLSRQNPTHNIAIGEAAHADRITDLRRALRQSVMLERLFSDRRD